MFSKSIFASVAAIAVATSGAVAKPIAAELTRRTDVVQVVSAPSFNNYLGLSTMSNFDDFFGQDNFDGSDNEQIIIIEEDDDSEFSCDSQDIEIVQQRLSILSEVAKSIILEQICEVEVQTIILEQFISGFSSFGDDISHLSGRSASFDQSIAGLLDQILESDGSLSNNDLGFEGSDIGSNSVIVSGNNWNDGSSPASVQQASQLSQQAIQNSTQSSNSTSSS
ncbi:hypothetical protein M0805_002365 [Coniferiporia weirii]|nr:hypothetical protein M0805_002365 [Coniferiporia weirii]